MHSTRSTFGNFGTWIALLILGTILPAFDVDAQDHKKSSPPAPAPAQAPSKPSAPRGTAPSQNRPQSPAQRSTAPPTKPGTTAKPTPSKSGPIVSKAGGPHGTAAPVPKLGVTSSGTTKGKVGTTAGVGPGMKSPVNSNNVPVSKAPVPVSRRETVMHPGVSTMEHPKPGIAVGRDSLGKAKYIHDDNRGLTINHDLRGERRVETLRQDHSKVVTVGKHAGYVEHGFKRDGHEYIRRTYMIGGRSDVRVYRSYYYHDIYYYHYIPAYYYGPAYYGWVYNPWPGPVYYGWGWGATAWYGYYGYYFAPDPYYPSPAFWLTDYVLAENLRLAYENQNDQPPADPAGSASVQSAPQNQNSSPAITPEVKKMIADEVRLQIGAERAAAEGTQQVNTEARSNTDEVPPALNPDHTVFVVSNDLDVAAENETCTLTPGDVVTRIENVPGDDQAVGVIVNISKPKDCRTGSKPRVLVSDLQEMQNDFRQKLAKGMGVLAQEKGKKGRDGKVLIPNGPDAEPSAVAEAKAVPDLTAAGDLKKQQQDANQAEREIQ